ncbi:large conductance mechanosensitive channel protein MscL [Paenibacillus hexagrammi]|uniref:Large-conductance mechanosensitive channel n=1 Tax=Paenibacillus hexagrammi TaxID=2908839 RepID=A0ABY3SG70_9BACL|nr:large conductance mechanosensitive channel protein MscL [Paenibacillus sp. YPD9-1]
MWKEFKTFALKGNVLDLAIGVIIGAAFGQIVTSLVDDLIMPLIGLLIGGVDLHGLHFQYGEAVINYGTFLQTVIDFAIITLSIFFVVKGIHRFKRKEKSKASESPAPKKEEILLSEIRDLLVQRYRNQGAAETKITLRGMAPRDERRHRSN